MAAIENCQTCRLRGEHFFCNLSEDALRTLDEVSYGLSYPEHAVLFPQNRPCHAVFILCSGRAKLSTAARDGKKVMLRVASAGEVLGLSSVLSGRHYDVTAETLSPALVRVVKREDFLGLLHQFSETTAHTMQALGQEYQSALESLRSLAWFPTASARVAQLLLHLCAQADGSSGEPRAKLLLTQEQIAQMTATTRETVTRLFSQLRRDHIISIRGSDLIIRNRAALERLAS
jgi:CRP/FNR family transcriptional regulator